MQTEKTMQRLGWFMGRDELNPNSILAFSWFIGMNIDAIYTMKIVNLTEQPEI
jgi:hypothetical protein